MEIKLITNRENVEKRISSFLSKDSGMKVIDLLIQLGADSKEFGYSLSDISTMIPSEASSVLYDQLNNKIPDIWLIRNLIQHTEVDVNKQNRWGINTLMMAIDLGYKDIVKLLLANPKTDVNLQDGSGNTALMWAVSKRNDHFVRMLLKHPNINVNVKSHSNETALMRTCNFRCSCKFYRHYHLICSCNLGRKNNKIAKLLIERSETEVNVQNSDGWTGLMEASMYGHDEIVKMLLGRPDIDITIKRGDRTAWSWATSDIRENFPNIKPPKKKFIPYLQRLGKV